MAIPHLGGSEDHSLRLYHNSPALKDAVATSLPQGETEALGSEAMMVLSSPSGGGGRAVRPSLALLSRSCPASSGARGSQGSPTHTSLSLGFATSLCGLRQLISRL